MAAARLDFNFILLLNSAVDENWVCQRRLPQFIFGKWCCIRCSDLCKLFVNSKFHIRLHFVCVCMCSQTGLLFIIFVCSLYSPWATIRLLHHFGFACALILGYPVCVFRAIHTKYVMFRVSWRMSLKGSATHVRHKKMAMHLSLKPKYFQYTHSRCITSDFVLTWPSAVDRMFKLLTTFKSWH